MPTTNTLSRILRGAAIALVLVIVPACAAPAEAPQAQPEIQTELFLFIYRPGATWREGVPMAKQDGMREHGAYMQQLLNEGRLVAGGGFQDEGTAGGMAIVRAGGMDEAKAILTADPAVTTGTFAADLRHWRPRFGGVGSQP